VTLVSGVRASNHDSFERDLCEHPVAIITGRLQRSRSGHNTGVARTQLVGTSRTISKSRDLKPSPDLVLVDGEVSKKEPAVKVEAALSHLTIARAFTPTASLSFCVIPFSRQAYGSQRDFCTFFA